MKNGKVELNKETAMRLWSKQFGKNQKAFDFSGREMAKAAYGDRGSKFGWNLDHIYPQSLGGKDTESNLICCHILTNDEKADKFPCFTANDKRFEIQKVQNHYEIVEIDELETNFFDSKQGIAFFRKCLANEPENKFLGYARIFVDFSCDRYNSKGNDGNAFAIYQFIAELFKTNAIIVDKIHINYGYNSGIRYTFTIIDYDISTKDDTQQLLNNCIVLNTYGQYYFIPKHICDKMLIVCGMDCLDSPLEVNENEISRILNITASSSCCMVISELIRYNTDAAKEINKQSCTWYNYNYSYTKLREILSKK